MAGQKKADSPVRIIGSRELHQNLPNILNELQHPDVRYVLTVHGKPRAVLVGAEPFLSMVGDRSQTHPSETLVGLQLSALLGNDVGAIAIEDLQSVLDQNNATNHTNNTNNNHHPEKP